MSRSKYLSCSTVCVLTVTLLLTGIAQLQAKSKYLRTGRQVTIDGLGVRFKAFRDAKPEPPTPPTALKAWSNADPNKKFDVYDPVDLWRQDQFVGKWGNPLGNLTVAELKFPPPKDVPRVVQHMTTEDVYRKWADSQETPKWTEESIKEWLKAYTGCNLDQDDGKFRGPRGTNTLKFAGAGSNSSTLIYLIKRSRPTQLFIVAVRIADDADVEKSVKTVDKTIQSMTLFAPKKKLDDKQMSSRTGKGGNTKETAEFKSSREQVIRSIQNLKNWWYLGTGGYIIVSNVKQKRTIRDMEEDLVTCREAHQALFPLQAPLKAISVVKVFQERNEYTKYLGPEYEWTAGLWVADKKELVISPVNWGSSSERRKMLLNVIYHESFHQYLFYATNEMSTMPWFNEGHATFFEGIKFKGKKYEIEISEERLAGFRQSAAQVSIPNLLKMSYEQFYEKSRLTPNYCGAWALIYFLHKGAPVLRDKNNYSDIPRKYYEACLKTKNPVKATEIAWEGVDMNKFQEDFNAFWNSRTMVTRSKKYDVFEKK